MDNDGRKGFIELVEMVWSGIIDINMVENGMEVMEWYLHGKDSFLYFSPSFHFLILLFLFLLLFFPSLFLSSFFIFSSLFRLFFFSSFCILNFF